MKLSMKGIPRNLQAQYRALINGIVDSCMDGVYDMVKDMTSQVEAATSTWNTPAKFTVKRPNRNTRVIDISISHPHFSYVNEGTSYRWAAMTGDWKSKSIVRSLHAGPGAGRVWLKGRKQMNAAGFGWPKKGIEARLFFYPAAQNSTPKLQGWIVQHLRTRRII